MRRRHVLAARPLQFELLQFAFGQRTNCCVKISARENLLQDARIFAATIQIQSRAPLSNGFVMHSFLRTHVPESFMSGGIIWKKLKRFRQLRSGAIVVTAKEQNRAVVKIGSRKERIKLHRAILLRDGFIEASEIGKAKAIMGRDIPEVRIEFHAASERSLDRSPIALVVHFNARERVVGLGKIFVELKRFTNGFFRQRPMLRWKNTIRCRPTMIKA